MTPRCRRGRGDAGFVAAWTVVIAVACWGMVGLVVDGGRALRERSSAFGAAASAARAGVQEIDERQAVLGVLALDEPSRRAAGPRVGGGGASARWVEDYGLARGAALKLRAGGIDPDRFVVGAYGSDHAHRPALPPIAAHSRS